MASVTIPRCRRRPAKTPPISVHDASLSPLPPNSSSIGSSVFAVLTVEVTRSRLGHDPEVPPTSSRDDADLGLRGTVSVPRPNSIRICSAVFAGRRGHDLVTISTCRRRLAETPRSSVRDACRRVRGRGRDDDVCARDDRQQTAH